MATIVTISGSMRFFPHMLEVASEETMKGNIVLAPFSVIPPDGQGGELKAMLDGLHFEKIAMSSRLIVVSDLSGYYGDSTMAEIAYARWKEIRVNYRRIEL